ncbi:MAG: nicotinamide riboside transporter PnuC, partial [Bacteroidia bacterium]
MFFDIIGTLVSLLSTYYFIRLNSNAWLVGIVATILNGWLYWHKGIYADMVLEIIYFLSMCYGWYLWQRRYPENKSTPIIALGRLKRGRWMLVLSVLCSLFAFIYCFLHTVTNSNVA